MKRLVAFLSMILMLSIHSFSANFNSGDKVYIDSRVNEDVYIGAGKITINAPIYGDLIAGGGEFDLNDSILGDVLIGGGQIKINGFIGDDVRISGGEISINGIVQGDVVIFGGSLEISKNARILGDVICFGGEVTLLGDVAGNVMIYSGEATLKNNIGGNVKIKSGEIEFDAVVEGDMELSAKEIELGSNAKCQGALRFWTTNETMDFSKVCASVTYDKELAFEDKEIDWAALGTLFSIGIISYWVIFILSMILVITLLEYFFADHFDRAAVNLNTAFIKSFGYGMLYFLGIPVLILFSFVILIGIPIGLLALSIYMVSFIFATSIIGLLIAHRFKNKSSKEWTFWQTVLYAGITVVIVKIIFMIPILGTMLKTIAMAGVYGSFFMLFFEGIRRRGSA